MTPWTVDPDTLANLRLDRAIRALEQEDPDRALVEAEELLETMPDHADALAIVGRAALEIGDATLAAAALTQLQAQGVDDPTTRLLLSRARFGAADLEGSLAAARATTDAQPDSAEAWFQQALCLERLDRPGPAALAWQRASALAPERFPLPQDLPDALWQACLDSAVAALPANLQAFYAEVPIRWASWPSVEALQAESPPLSPLLDCMYEGAPPSDPEDRDTVRPECVWLFRGNLRLPAPDAAGIARRIHLGLITEASDWLGLPTTEDPEPGAG